MFTDRDFISHGNFLNDKSHIIENVEQSIIPTKLCGMCEMRSSYRKNKSEWSKTTWCQHTALPSVQLQSLSHWGQLQHRFSASELYNLNDQLVTGVSIVLVKSSKDWVPNINTSWVMGHCRTRSRLSTRQMSQHDQCYMLCHFSTTEHHGLREDGNQIIKIY